MGQDENRPQITRPTVKNLIVKRRKFLIVFAAFGLLGTTLLTRSQAATFNDGNDRADSGASQTENLPKPDKLTEAALIYEWGEPLAASDEFDYGSTQAPARPDSQKWLEPTGTLQGKANCDYGYNNNGLRCAKNNAVKDGSLILQGEASADTGWLQQKDSPQYGRWEVRSRLLAADSATGIGGSYRPAHAYQLTTGDQYAWAEADDPSTGCLMAYASTAGSYAQGSVQKCGLDMGQWHNFAFERSASLLRGYVDGIQWFEFPVPATEAVASGAYTIRLDGPAELKAVRPAQLEVDWVRTYAAPTE